MEKPPQTVFGQRLHQARLMSGFSLRELSEKIGNIVSHTALAKYEKGSGIPNSTVHLALAKALGQSASFFIRPLSLELKEIKFRKHVRLSKETEISIRERARDFFERYCEIEEIVGDIRKFENPLSKESIETPDQAEEKANELRKKWKLGVDPISSVYELLEQKGIKVFEVNTDDQDIDGFTAMTNLGPVVVMIKRSNQNVLRMRHTAAHELAHIVLQIHDQNLEEKLVARFAGAFLLPKETFVKQFGGHRKSLSISELINLKVIFGTSISSIMTRARQLDLIDQTLAVRFWQKFGNKWRASGCEDGDPLYQGQERLCRFDSLVYRAATEDLITETKGAALLNMGLLEFREKLIAL